MEKPQTPPNGGFLIHKACKNEAESDQSQETSKSQTKFRIGPLKTLHQVLKAKGKTIRAMANGTLKTEDRSRIVARKVDGRVYLYTKQGYDWSRKYPLIAEALYRLRATSPVLDGDA